jgi:glycosyltransferase involved in cell wall biosynthesis
MSSARLSSNEDGSVCSKPGYSKELTDVAHPEADCKSCGITVTIIMPVKNDLQYVGLALSNIRNQTYPPNQMEVIVVDAMSTDGSRNAVMRFAAENKQVSVKMIDDRKGQRAHALNLAIGKATGSVILRIDARTIVPSDYVERCVRLLFEQDAANVGGTLKPIGTSPTQKAIGIGMSHPFGVGHAEFRLGRRSGCVDTVYLGCFRREVFAEIGLFDEDSPVISEDSDINFRIRQKGGKVYLDHTLNVFYYTRDNLIDLWKLYFRYGGARAGFIIKHKRSTTIRPFLAAGFVCVVAALTILSAFLKPAAVMLLILSGVYVVVDMLVSTRLAAEHNNIRLIVPLLFAFPCMHFSYGIGFVRRLAEGRRRKAFWGH